MRRITTILAVAALTNAGSALAELNSSVAFTTDYVFRGISQTDEEAAVQGSIEYVHESGFYAGIWGSNVDFNDNDEAQTEIDWYVGFADSAGGLGYDLGLIYYSYPGASSDLDYDFFEATAAVTGTFGVADLEGRINYSPEYFGDSGDAYYVQINGSAELTPNVGLTVHAGMQGIDENAVFGTDDYVDWSVGLATAIQDVELSLVYSDTDLEAEECFGGAELCDWRVVFSALRSF